MWMADTIRTARNPHICLWCKERISKGTSYTEVRWADGNEHGITRYHTECRAAQPQVPHDELDWWEDEGCVPDYVRGGTILKELANER